MSTQHPAVVAESHGDDESDARRYDLTFARGAKRTGEITALRDDAATLEFIARRWSRALPAGRTDVRADIALLKMIAGNARGFARTMEEATS